MKVLDIPDDVWVARPEILKSIDTLHEFTELFRRGPMGTPGPLGYGYREEYLAYLELVRQYNEKLDAAQKWYDLIRHNEIMRNVTLEGLLLAKL